MKSVVRDMNYLGDKPYRMQPINTADIKTDLYQREIDPQKVNRIVANFDKRIANEPKLSYRNGKFYVFDGQHTIEAMKKLNGNRDLFILCKVYEDLSAEEEAMLFSYQTGVSSKPTPGVTLRARNIGNDKDSIDFVEANLAVGISPSYSLARGTYRLRCINTAKGAYDRVGPDLYKEAMSIIVQAWKGHPKALIGSVVLTMCNFVKIYLGEYDKAWIIRKLSYSDPYDIVIKAKSLGDDGGPKSALKHVLDLYNHNNPKQLSVKL
jgi:hypothetical protein